MGEKLTLDDAVSAALLLLKPLSDSRGVRLRAALGAEATDAEPLSERAVRMLNLVLGEAVASAAPGTLLEITLSREADGARLIIEDGGVRVTLEVPRGEALTSPEPSPDLRGVQVLWLEDGADLVVDALEASGAQVRAVRHVKDAWSIFRAARPDVLVCALTLPAESEEDAFELIGRVRALPELDGGSVPAIALGGAASSLERTHALQAGFTAFAAKPLPLGPFLASVARLAGRG